MIIIFIKVMMVVIYWILHGNFFHFVITGGSAITIFSSANLTFCILIMLMPMTFTTVLPWLLRLPVWASLWLLLLLCHHRNKNNDNFLNCVQVFGSCFHLPLRGKSKTFEPCTRWLADSSATDCFQKALPRTCLAFSWQSGHQQTTAHCWAKWLLASNWLCLPLFNWTQKF